MSPRAVTLVGWAVLAVGALVLEVLAHRSDDRLVGAGRLLAQVADHPAGKAALLVGWAWLGWHLFVR